MSSYQMIHIMEGVVERGTAQKLKVLSRPIAGKTGTTNDEKDGWFIGFTPDLVVGVYMGFDNPSPMGHGETGGNVSAPVVRDFFKIALADQPPIPFRAPPGIKMESVNLKTGLPAAPGDPKAIMEAFKPTQEPLGAVATDDSGSQEGLAPEEYGQAGPTPPIPGVVPGGDAGPPPSPSTVSQKPPAGLRSKGTITAGRTPASPAPGLLGRIFGGF
jgi:penicillin-binding protein 1A